jgi:hypothetical protein
MSGSNSTAGKDQASIPFIAPTDLGLSDPQDGTYLSVFQLTSEATFQV